MSNNVVKSRIDNISENILKQVIKEVATSLSIWLAAGRKH